MAGLSTLIPANISFVWLDEYSEDFEALKQSFCKKTSTNQDNWTFYDNKDKCSHFIKQTDSKQNIVLISSGRLGCDIIRDLNHLPQIHSIYVYCHRKDKYEPFKTSYSKVREIFDDPIQLEDQIYRNLNEEVRQSQWDISIRNDILPIPKNTTDRLHCLFRNELKSYYTPDILYCPWQTNSCTISLPSKGQGTIELWLHESIPFELCLSNKQNLHDTNTNSYAIVLRVDTHEAVLGTINDQHGHTLYSRDRTTELYQILQLNDDYWHCYWLTFYGIDRMAQYGIGEIRPKFKILEAHLPECDKTSLENISYLHIKINNSTDINTIKYLKDKLRIFIGKEPAIIDPPLLIISSNEFSSTNPANNNGILACLLPDSLRNLYVEIINFTLNDDSFPNFIETIERSIRNPNGWCRQKLEKKANQFGRPRAEATYLCITMDEHEKGTTMIKIWPPGYYSPIHNHRDAYGIIRVLHGKLLVKYFPALSLTLRQNSLIEQLFEKDSVTWMMPKLNQTHQMKNPDMYGSCCITIQSYHYETDERRSSECFSFITNDDHHIEHYNCLPDDNYLAFKKIMQMESMSENTVRYN